MKKLLLLSFLSLGLLSFSPTSYTKSGDETSISKNPTVDCYYSQCQAIAKSTGEQCKHCVSNEGDSFCWQHD
jgi:hypothetical protein